MFDNHQADQGQNSNNADQGSGTAPTLGIGMNPSPTYVPPSDSTSPPMVVAPSSSGGSVGGPSIVTSSPAPATVATDKLEEIKRNALEQLSPLVSKLDQTPEEKYKTIMMMIQASDNQALIDEAYENAQKITDEKVRAEALLNIVNEINYFTQKNPS